MLLEMSSFLRTFPHFVF